MYLLFKTPSKRSLGYNVVIRTFNNISKNKHNKLVYDCTVSLKKEISKGYTISIKKDNVQLNDTVEHDPVNEILLIAGEILAGLELEIFESGKIKKIVNLDEIRKKAERIKFKIESTYKGDLVSRILYPMLQKLESEDELIESLDKDPLLFYLIKGVYGQYEKNKKKFNGQLWGISDSVLRICKTNKSSVNDDGTIRIDFEMLTDPEDVNRFEEQLTDRLGKGTLDMKLDGNYIFSSSHYLESLTAGQTISWNNEVYKSLTINIQAKPE